MQRLVLFFGVIFFITSCQKESETIAIGSTAAPSQFTAAQNHNPYFCNSPSEAEAGQIYNQEGKTWLWGGRGEGQDFNISGWSLEVQNLGSGLGRELIKALVFPTYEKASKQKIKDDAKVIVLKGKQETKIYTYDLLTKHELVNDIIDGQPVLVAYCPLADLAVVYKRTYCDTELFFALSGYTYIEKNEKQGRNNSTQNIDIESFILWDRNTESLWYQFKPICPLQLSLLYSYFTYFNLHNFKIPSHN